MTKRLTIIFSLLLAMLAFAADIHGQTLAEARKLYNEGQFAQAKPAFERLVKGSPANANYNLWYGVCCLRTGEADKAVEYLRNAVKRRATDGRLYLGEALADTYLYEESIEQLESYIADLAKRKKTSAQAEELLERSRMGLRMIRGVENVVVIDSFVVDKDDFLDAYKISAESGQLSMFDQFFGLRTDNGNVSRRRSNDEEAVVPIQTSGIAIDSTATDAAAGNATQTAVPQFRGNRTVYRTELGNQIFFADQRPDSALAINTAFKQGDGWSSPTPLPDNVNFAGASTAYPYVMPDGAVTYYASTGGSNLGGYDIFVTRYNPDTSSYYDPENIGMPFNSPYNDYMYVIDEFSNLGWFASDRRQPADKVCIYVFIPNATKQVYSYEELGADKTAQMAQLTSIRDTWSNQGDVDSALARLTTAGQPRNQQTGGSDYDFTFVIDDSRTYHSISDFRSTEARNAFLAYQKSATAYRQTSDRLAAMRNEYAGANGSRRQSLKNNILSMEKQEADLYADMRQAEKNVRKLEAGRQ